MRYRQSRPFICSLHVNPGVSLIHTGLTHHSRSQVSKRAQSYIISCNRRNTLLLSIECFGVDPGPELIYALYIRRRDKIRSDTRYNSYTVPLLSTHKPPKKHTLSEPKSADKNDTPFLNACNKLKVDLDHHTRNPRNQCTEGYSHLEGPKSKLVNGLVDFHTLQ